jgi:hypothetical protein
MICEKCIPRELKAMRALESLTPSGSEFVNDVERCVEFVRGHSAAQMRVIVTMKIQTDRLRESNDRLRKEIIELKCIQEALR